MCQISDLQPLIARTVSRVTPNVSAAFVCVIPPRTASHAFMRKASCTSCERERASFIKKVSSILSQNLSDCDLFMLWLIRGLLFRLLLNHFNPLIIKWSSFSNYRFK